MDIAPLSLDWLHFLHTGQSLGQGVHGTPVLSTVESLGNLALHDSGGTYALNSPNAATLSVGSSAAPVKTLGPGNYPANLGGEIPDSRFADQFVTLAAAGGSGVKTVQTNICVGGASIVSISKQSTSPPIYQSGLYEVAAVRQLANAAGKNHAVGCILLTHGEQDADLGTSRAVYAAGVSALRRSYQDDINFLTGRSSPIILIASQQTSQPTVGSGPNTTAPGILDAAALDGGIFVSGPKYQYTYFTDNEHMINTSYVLLGEKYAQVYYSILAHGGWTPLQPTRFVVAGPTVTITFNVPVAPLVFDFSQGQPHQSGTFALWAAGNGFEVSDGGGNIGITSATIVGSTVVLALARSVGAGGICAYAQTSDLGNGNNTGGFQSGAGCCGNLRDSDPFTGISTVTQPNWCVAFSQAIT